VAQAVVAMFGPMVDYIKKGRGARMSALLSLTLLALAAAGCGSSSSSGGSSSPSSSGSGSAAVSGTANVAYAASLAFLNEKIVGPAFAKATGLKYAGRAGPSDGLESEIASGQITPDVFEAVGGDNITPLFPKFTSWYVQYATTSIVLAYNPKSKYASQFAAIAAGKKPITALFPILEKPGFKLGRTDPNLDPQGRAFIYMLELAQMVYHLPADTVHKIIGSAPGSANSSEIFDEAALEPRLQAGQLDASSAYLSQAIQLHLHYIKLPASINLGSAGLAPEYHKASITITGNVTKHGSPLTIDITTIKNSAAGAKFAAYVLSPAGLALHKQGGYTLLPPMLTGSGEPAAVKSELGG
jgi:molybdate/tungstate transport system substrate-binding protein